VLRATQLGYIKLLTDPDNNALKKEYTFWMDSNIKNQKATMPTEYSSASEIIEKHGK
jgi:hypothetical protein